MSNGTALAIVIVVLVLIAGAFYLFSGPSTTTGTPGTSAPPGGALVPITGTSTGSTASGTPNTY